MFSVIYLVNKFQVDIREFLFSLLVTPQTVTLDNKPNYDKGRGICLLSLVNTTNIYFGGQKTLTVPLSESNYLHSIL